MENEIQSLTKGRQHLGMHINFNGDLFVASHLLTGRAEMACTGRRQGSVHEAICRQLKMGGHQEGRPRTVFSRSFPVSLGGLGGLG